MYAIFLEINRIKLFSLKKFLSIIKMSYPNFLHTNVGNKKWRICSCKDSALVWETSSTNIKAGSTLLAYMGASI